jgi:undecaprenyldiphospho-muramoylpentapeptide beta-N-acetylglucosaminyltransferase
MPSDPDHLPTSERPETWALVAGGGTAGHLLPGLAVAGALVAAGHDPATIHFVGSDRGVEATMVPAAGFTFDELPGRGIQRRLTLANVGAVVGLIRGVLQGIAIVWRRKPAVVVALGGHASFACGLAAVLLRRPLVLLEQNVRAGAVNRVLGRFATAAAVSFEGTDLPRAVVTGNPLRPEIRAAADADRDVRAARAHLALPADRIVLAVFSGSLGSRRINTAVRGLAERWADRNDLAIRHVIGKRDFDEFTADLPRLPVGGLVYQPVAYEDRMHLLLTAADVAVTRAGGGVFELAAMGVPSILVPLPIATRDHQSANAAALAVSGGAIVIPDGECTTDRLEAELTPLLARADLRAKLADAMRSAAVPDAAERVARLVEERARA